MGCHKTNVNSHCNYGGWMDEFLSVGVALCTKDQKNMICSEIGGPHPLKSSTYSVKGGRGSTLGLLPWGAIKLTLTLTEIMGDGWMNFSRSAWLSTQRFSKISFVQK